MCLHALTSAEPNSLSAEVQAHLKGLGSSRLFKCFLVLFLSILIKNKIVPKTSLSYFFLGGGGRLFRPTGSPTAMENCTVQNLESSYLNIFISQRVFNRIVRFYHVILEWLIGNCVTDSLKHGINLDTK